MDTSARDSQRLIAYHEAGHAVVLRYYGRKIRAVSIRPPHGQEEWRGETVADDGQATLDDDNELLVYFAGFVAENKYLTTNNKTAIDFSVFEDDKRYLNDRFGIDKILQKKVEVSLIEQDDIDPISDLYLLFLIKTVRLFEMPSLWHAIQIIAEIILKNNYLCGPRAMKIIDANLMIPSKSG